MLKQLIILLSVVCLLAANISADKGRISGGSNAPEDAYPYQVSLQSGEAYDHVGGAAIINENYIVTLASSFNYISTDDVSVLVGTTDKRNEDGKGSRHAITNCTKHPDYFDEGLLKRNDIAVCRLTEPLVYGSNIGPIELETEFVGGGVDCTLTGWGLKRPRIGSSSTSPNELQVASVPTITDRQCLETIYDIESKHICTFFPGIEACYRDEGSPLACNNKLVGLVSFGFKLCDGVNPDVYTRVSEYVDFIEENTRDW